MFFRDAKSSPCLLQKRSSRASPTPIAIKQEPTLASRRPARKSKVEARAKMADAEAKAAAAAAAIDEASSSDSDSSSSNDEEEEEEEGGHGDATIENGTGETGEDIKKEEEEEKGGGADKQNTIFIWDF